MTFKIFDDVIIYEPTLKAEQFNNCKVIVVKDKVYTRDLYSRD